ATAVAQLHVDAMAHLAGGFVGEGHREYAMGRHTDDFIEPGDTVGEYAGLAGTGASEDQVMAGRRGDGLALGCIQPVEQVGNIHARILRHRAGRGLSTAYGPSVLNRARCGCRHATALPPRARPMPLPTGARG